MSEAQLNACNEKLERWKEKGASKYPYSTGTPLPMDLWEKILTSICCDDFEPNGVRGPSVVARDIAKLSVVCKELHAGALLAYQYLARLCPPMPEGLEALWKDFLEDPDGLVLNDTKKLAKAAGVKMNQKKPFLVVDIVEALRLNGPTNLPPRLLMAVHNERKQRIFSAPAVYQKYMVLPVNNTDRVVDTVFRMRASLEERGIRNQQDLDAAVRRVKQSKAQW